MINLKKCHISSNTLSQYVLTKILHRFFSLQNVKTGRSHCSTPLFHRTLKKCPDFILPPFFSKKALGEWSYALTNLLQNHKKGPKAWHSFPNNVNSLFQGSGGSLLGVMVSDKGCGHNGQGIYTRVESKRGQYTIDHTQLTVDSRQ